MVLLDLFFTSSGLFTQPLDEANPATCITSKAKSTPLLQMAGWLISFPLDGVYTLTTNERRMA